MSYQASFATAVSQLRQAYVQCIINKNDPYNAITFIQNMMACLPPNHRPKEDSLPKQPKNSYSDFVDDPDDNTKLQETWRFVREYSKLAEGTISEYQMSTSASRYI